MMRSRVSRATVCGSSYLDIGVHRKRMLIKFGESQSCSVSPVYLVMPGRYARFPSVYEYLQNRPNRIRDAGVAGSNPVVSTIKHIEYQGVVVAHCTLIFRSDGPFGYPMRTYGSRWCSMGIDFSRKPRQDGSFRWYDLTNASHSIRIVMRFKSLDWREHGRHRSSRACVGITGWAPHGGEANTHRSHPGLQDSSVRPLRGHSFNPTPPHPVLLSLGACRLGVGPCRRRLPGNEGEHSLQGRSHLLPARPHPVRNGLSRSHSAVRLVDLRASVHSGSQLRGVLLAAPASWINARARLPLH